MSNSGASGTLNIIPGHASIANQVFGKFISRLPHKRSELIPPEISKRDRMKKALSTLAGIIGDGSIENRSPLSSLSFCCLPPEVVKDQTDSVNQRRKRLAHAHTLLSPEGRPLRRYASCWCCSQTLICFQIFREENRSLVSQWEERIVDCRWISAKFRFTILMACQGQLFFLQNVLVTQPTNCRLRISVRRADYVVPQVVDWSRSVLSRIRWQKLQALKNLPSSHFLSRCFSALHIYWTRSYNFINGFIIQGNRAMQ